MKKLTAIVLSSLAVVNCTKTPESSNSIVAKESVTTVGVTEVIPVTAIELFEAYGNSQLEADKKYKGKLLEIRGVVLGVDTELVDNTVIQLGEEDVLLNIFAEIDTVFDRASIKVLRGQEVTFICSAVGNIVGSPVLNNCTFKP